MKDKDHAFIAGFISGGILVLALYCAVSAAMW